MSVQNSAVLTIINPVLGVDLHNTWPIGSPAPLPAPTPYVWLQILGGLAMPTVRKAAKTFSNTFPVVQRGSDIGPLIVHVGTPSLLLPFIIIGSGSVSEFGSFTVLVEKLPTASAFPLVYVTYNLNCQGSATPPCPLPTGIVMAPSTTFVGMQIGDIIASAVAMAADMLVTAIANKLGSAIAGKLISRFIGPFAMRLTPYIFELPRVQKAVQVIVLNIPPLLIGILGLGSPVGYSPSYTPLGGFYGEYRDSKLNPLAKYFNPSSGADM